MRTKTSLSLLFVALFSLSLFAGETEKNPVQPFGPMPDEVKAIVDKSCIGCHNTDSRNEDAKKELDFKKLDTLSKVKMISTYKEISETLEKNEMPPKKFLEKYPDKALSETEKKVLLSWAKKETKALVKAK
ncbi:heme-binding domain-containing protein [Maribellus sp. CM-23]|uniref:heme-binding domain-containing protein n=1 Tax=Maribellus sp. CM-23 TaxID=2781026 RepID=UPI001F4383BF|nr:heme-binding domain-containing protein [Maribellus sp. CM-23]MCE4564858.1 heme-binding domain-containing protein [Maribellus sp. CM-23]